MRAHLVSLCTLTTALAACQPDKDQTTDSGTDDGDKAATFLSPDTNGDGRIDILVLGTSTSVDEGEAFEADGVAEHLALILAGHDEVEEAVDVVPMDLYASAPVTFGLGGRGDEYTVDHHRHSLIQYLHWPDGMAERHAELEGLGERDWDHVVLMPDPAIVSTAPGVHALGVHRVAGLVARGGATPHLVMGWRSDPSADTTVAIASVTRAVADGSDVGVSVIPAGLAWETLPDELRDEARFHPSPNGAYLTAAAIHARLTASSAADSTHEVNADLAQAAVAALESYDTAPAAEAPTASPHASCGVTDLVITWHHTGTSSENGILDGLRWVFDQAPESLEAGGDPMTTFNYGRANSNFEADKRYDIDPDRFRFSFGFPMQDHANHGDTSMRYGLDRRDAGVMNDTDLGVARFMVTEGELPEGRAVPVRTLFAEMWALDNERSAYRDAWHMHRDLDKAIAAYMYTLLTGSCALGEEPEDVASEAWATWRAHKVGCDTAWTMSTLQDGSPF